MADKELRRMNRTELIEIIYALQQNEQKLREENDKMAAELEDRKIRMDESGSIAEAALSLNHIFEDAQAAADQYLSSLKSREEEQVQEPPHAAETEPGGPENLLKEEEPEAVAEETDPESEKTAEDTKPQTDQILEDACREADELLAATRMQAEPAAENGTSDAESESEEILENARRQADEILSNARREAEDILTSAREQTEAGTAEGAKQEADAILEDARRQADEILNDARQEADEILTAAREEAQAESQKTLESAKEQCDTERQAVKEYHDKFLRDMSDILKENPELLERVRQMGTIGGQ